MLVDAGITARILKQHQREQAYVLRLFGQKLTQGPAQTDGLSTQLVADQALARGGGVSFVEYQVDDGFDRCQPLGQHMNGWDFVGNSGVANLGLGPDQPLRQRGFGKQEGAGNLWGSQAAERAQR